MSDKQSSSEKMLQRRSSLKDTLSPRKPLNNARNSFNNTRNSNMTVSTSTPSPIANARNYKLSERERRQQNLGIYKPFFVKRDGISSVIETYRTQDGISSITKTHGIEGESLGHYLIQAETSSGVVFFVELEPCEDECKLDTTPVLQEKDLKLEIELDKHIEEHIKPIIWKIPESIIIDMIYRRGNNLVKIRDQNGSIFVYVYDCTSINSIQEGKLAVLLPVSEIEKVLYKDEQEIIHLNEELFRNLEFRIKKYDRLRKSILNFMRLEHFKNKIESFYNQMNEKIGKISDSDLDSSDDLVSFDRNMENLLNQVERFTIDHKKSDITEIDYFDAI